MDSGTFYRRLSRIDRKEYYRGKELIGEYSFPNFVLKIISVPKDPYLRPGRMKVVFPFRKLGYPESISRNRDVVAHFINREMSEMNGRMIKIYRPTNIVIERSSCIVGRNIELSFDFYIPFRKRKIDGEGMKEIISDIERRIENLSWKRLEKRDLLKKMCLVREDQEELRKRMKKEGIVAFVANGSILPREKFSRKPMKDAKPFRTVNPTVLEGRHGRYEGLAIEKGKFTVITGMNFQGKSTLLDAIGVSFYNHEYGDGREFVLGEEMAFAGKENGRWVNCTSLKPFMNKTITTPNASGSISQMANVSEAIKAGKGLLIDEDDSAINFLLSAVVGDSIRPFENSIPDSTVVMVSSALKQFIEKADKVVVMEDFEAKSSTERKGCEKISYEKWKCKEMVGMGKIEKVEKFRIHVSGRYIDLSGPISKTIYERAQAYFLADLLELAMGMEGDRWEIAGKLYDMIKRKGFSITGKEGNYTMVTRYQIYYMLNRYPFMKGRNQLD